MKTPGIHLLLNFKAAAFATAALIWGGQALAGDELRRLDVLQTISNGTTNLYRNVTVLSTNKRYVVVSHTKGMANLRVADLSPEARENLGYNREDETKSRTNNAAVWAKKTLASLESGPVKKAGDQALEQWRTKAAGKTFAGVRIPPPSTGLILGLLAALVAWYVFFCACCQQICQKAGHPAGALVWVPWLQFIPLLRAAGMSAWWVVGCLVPLVNVVGYFVWCMKIAAARNKTPLVGFLLFLPVTNVLAFLFLAFSGGSPGEEAKKENRRIEIMSLEAT